MEGTYTLMDKTGQRHLLTRLEVSQGKETLGVFIAMDGNQTNQIAELETKSKEYAAQIMASTCDYNTAVYSYNSCFMKSLEYCMPVTSIGKESWTTIVKHVKQHM